MQRWFLSILFCLPHMGSAIDLAVPIEELANYFPDRKRHLKWHESGFDPLKIEVIRTQAKDSISDEDKGYLNTIKSYIKEKGVSGIVFGRGGLEGKILIGDHVFSPADELIFVNERGEFSSINKERAVILLEITQEKGVFLVSGKNALQDKGTKEGVKFEIIWEDFFKF